MSTMGSTSLLITFYANNNYSYINPIDANYGSYFAVCHFITYHFRAFGLVGSEISVPH